jgi:signal transduction histidine kinase
VLTDLSAVVASALRIAAIEIHAHVEIEVHFEEGVIALAHGARVVQIVLNLVLNAAQAVDPTGAREGRIVVRSFVQRDRACIDVADTGPGVPAEIAERIFEPFYTTRADEGGTGIGLWLSRSMVEEDGGKLWFENQPQGGARFVVELPSYPQPG